MLCLEGKNTSKRTRWKEHVEKNTSKRTRWKEHVEKNWVKRKKKTTRLWRWWWWDITCSWHHHLESTTTTLLLGMHRTRTHDSETRRLGDCFHFPDTRQHLSNEDNKRQKEGGRQQNKRESNESNHCSFLSHVGYMLLLKKEKHMKIRHANVSTTKPLWHLTIKPRE